jgi:predicted permease
MQCAYAFAAIAFIGLPVALEPGGEGNIAWIAQTFLQLVLLSIIIVGQNIAAASSDTRSENTFKNAEANLSEALEIQKHLRSQEEELNCASPVKMYVMK